MYKHNFQTRFNKMIFVTSIKPLPTLRKTKLFICSYAGISLVIGVCCLIWCILYKFVLLRIPSSDLMFQAGELTYAIFVSIIASVIFYFMVSYIPDYKKKQSASIQIEFWLNQIVKHGEFMLNALSGDFSTDVYEKYRENWTNITNKPLKSDKAIIISNLFEFQDWFDFFDYIFEEEDYYIGKLEKYTQYLPVELIMVFDKLENMDSLRSAVRQYKENYGIEIVPGFKYDNMSGFEKVLLLHIENMLSVLKVYQEHSI